MSLTELRLFLLRLFADLPVEVCYIFLCRIENFVLVTGLSHSLFHADFPVVLQDFVVIELEEAYDSRGQGLHGECLVAFNLAFNVVEEGTYRSFKSFYLILC